jgi:hypothetical protein
MPEQQAQVIDHPTSGTRGQVVSPLFPSLSFTNVMSKVDGLATRVPWWLWYLFGVGTVLILGRVKKKGGVGNFFQFGKGASGSGSSGFGRGPRTSE